MLFSSINLKEVNYLFVTMLFSIFCIATASAGVDSAIAVLQEKQGTVEARSMGDTNWLPAEVGKAFERNDRVAARDLSRGVVSLPPYKTIVRINANTELVIFPELLIGRSFGIEISKGEIYVHSRDEHSSTGITTPVVRAYPSGTQYMIEVGEDGSTIFTMFEGTVELKNEFGSLWLNASEQALVEPGQAPRKTAVIMARNLVQWCLYYPGVLNLSDIEFFSVEQVTLGASISAYQQGDLLAALEAWPEGFEGESPGATLFRSMLLLSAGQVEAATDKLSELPEGTPEKGALLELIAGINFVDLGERMEPSSSTAWLARSYYEQSQGRLQMALEAAYAAVELAPDFGFAKVRVAELNFSFGETTRATEYLEDGLLSCPRNAQALALNGFLLCADNDVRMAATAFEQAIQVDSALGNAWLGLGLCHMRTGNREEAWRCLQVATVLEPNRSLFHSYLGKVAGELGWYEQADMDLAYARELDPSDPTPWLYAGLLERQKYNPAQAIRSLEKSIELNDNRRVYRSRLHLDQDRAVRNANLAAIYRDNGMRDIAVSEATRAVENDYTNASAHLFLANSFDALRDPRRVSLRYETAWFNELLLANLLAPVGGGTLSQFVSSHEYSRLFESDGTGGMIDATFFSDSEHRVQASLHGTYGKLSFGLDYADYADDGDRPNSDISRKEIYGQLKYQLTRRDMVYFLGKWQELEGGDTFQTYDDEPLSSDFRFKETQEPGLCLMGWNHSWGPGSHTLILGGLLEAGQSLTDRDTTQLLIDRDLKGLAPGFVTEVAENFYAYTNPDYALNNPPVAELDTDWETLIYNPQFLEDLMPYVGQGSPFGLATSQFDFETHRKFRIRTVELQHIEQLDTLTIVAGGKLQDGDINSSADLTLIRPAFGGFPTPASDQIVLGEFNRSSLYAYNYWNPVSKLLLIGGVAWDRIEHPANFRNPPLDPTPVVSEKFSAKAGFSYSASPSLTVRGAYTQGLGGVTFDESVRLEPVQVAGFNQSYRTLISESLVGSVEAPEFEVWGLSLVGKINPNFWWELTATNIEQAVERTVGAFSGYYLPNVPFTPAYFPDGTRQLLDYSEESVDLVLNALVGENWSVGCTLGTVTSLLHLRYPDLASLYDPGTDIRDKARLHRAILYAIWNSPKGYFMRTEVAGYSQKLTDDPARTSVGEEPRQGDEFMQVNLFAGYRFFRNQAEIEFGVYNLGDVQFQLSPLNYFGELYRRRTAFVRVRCSF